jgi:TRAP-type C4-dicarboxylate transport system substrate-binding protein
VLYKEECPLKKLVLGSLVVVLISALILAGCAEPAPTPAPEPAPAPTPAPAPEPEPAPAPSQEVFKLKYASPYQVFEAPTIEGQSFCDYVMENSGGRIEIKTYPGASLASGAEHMQLVRAGGADLATLLPTSFKDLIPFGGGHLTQFQQPLSEAMPWMHSLVLDNPETAPIFEKDFAQQNLKFICDYACSATQGFPCNFLPASCLADLQGKKMGVLASHTYLAELGMSSINTAPEEVYESLSRGVYDAMEIAIAAWGVLKLYEVTKAALLTQTDTSTLMPILVMNLDTWQSLPPDLQQVCWDAVPPTLESSITLVEKMEGEALQTFRDNGVEINTLSPEEQTAFYKLYFDDWERDFRELCEQRGVWGEGQVILKWTKEYAYPK